MYGEQKCMYEIFTFNIHTQTYTVVFLFRYTQTHTPCLNNKKIANNCGLETVILVY